MRAAWALLAMLPGCSWMFMKVLPEQPVAGESYACSSLPTAPIIDSLVVAYGVATIVATVIEDLGPEPQCPDDYQFHPECDIPTAVGYVWGAIALSFAPSAYYGFKQVRRCRAYQAGQLPLMPPGPQGPPM